MIETIEKLMDELAAVTGGFAALLNQVDYQE